MQSRMHINTKDKRRTGPQRSEPGHCGGVSWPHTDGSHDYGAPSHISASSELVQNSLESLISELHNFCPASLMTLTPKTDKKKILQ